jgi:hypothetical protein
MSVRALMVFRDRRLYPSGNSIIIDEWPPTAEWLKTFNAGLVEFIQIIDREAPRVPANAAH